MNLSKLSNQHLLDELARRLAACGEIKSKAAPVFSGQNILPPRNSAFQQMVRSLRAGVHRGQSVEVLKFLESNPRPQAMAQIAAHMKRRGYTATRYYDASNALVEVGLAKKTEIGYDRAWQVTPEGLAFLKRVRP